MAKFRARSLLKSAIEITFPLIFLITLVLLLDLIRDSVCRYEIFQSVVPQIARLLRDAYANASDVTNIADCEQEQIDARPGGRSTPA